MCKELCTNMLDSDTKKMALRMYVPELFTHTPPTLFLCRLLSKAFIVQWSVKVQFKDVKFALHIYKYMHNVYMHVCATFRILV